MVKIMNDFFVVVDITVLIKRKRVMKTPTKFDRSMHMKYALIRKSKG